MSIAVRVSVWILGALVAISAAVAVLAILQKQTLQVKNQNLTSRIAGDEANLSTLNSQAQKLQDQAADLNNKVNQIQQDKAQLQSAYDDLKHKSDDLQSQLTQANSQSDDLKTRVDTITRDRDNLMAKLRSQPVKIVYRNRIVKVPVAGEGGEENAAAAVAAPVTPPSGQSDQYWADILKQKAALQVQVEKEKYDLNQAALQVADLKKQNLDLEGEVKQLNNEKDEIVEKIKYGQDLADNLSIDLARSRNDQEEINERADRVKEQNLELLSEVRDLSSTKVELEKTVARLTDDKDEMQKKLIETQAVIQSRIDDIWKIKQSLDRKLAENAAVSTQGTGVELPPIIVNAPAANQQQAASSAMSMPVQGEAQAAAAGKNQGTIISINESNNFVITDLGQQNSPVSIGTPLKVFRDSNPIATLEVIQVRKDICAADIKDKSADLQVGDIVRFE